MNFYLESKDCLRQFLLEKILVLSSILSRYLKVIGDVGTDVVFQRGYFEKPKFLVAFLKLESEKL